jgi:hypothetical protein
VADVDVTLEGVTHPSPDDLDVILEAPGGTSVVLMSHVGGTNPVAGVDLTFDDEARASLADDGPIATGAYRPAGGSLADFDGVAAAGRWILHIVDGGQAGGSVAGGWSLAVTRCGQSRPAVVHLSTDWFIRDSLSTGEATTLLTFGTRPQTALLGDWDGDGIATPGRYAQGTFHLTNGDGGGGAGGAGGADGAGASPLTFTFGDRFGFPVSGDFDHDGRDDVAVYRDGTWEIRYIADGTTGRATLGTGTWPRTIPLAGDWNGDGTDGIGTWSAGVWALRDAPVGDGPPDRTFTLGPAAGAYPVVGDWTAVGTDSPGLVEFPKWTLYFDDPLVAGDELSVYTTFEFGQPDELPLVGP